MTMYATRIALLTLLYQLVASTAESLHPLSDDSIELLNKEGKWKAGRNFPSNTPMEYIKQLVGTHVDYNELRKLPVVKYDFEDIDDLPESFDPRKRWASCPSLNEIRDQGQCGACWAFGAVGAMTDRVCIHSNGTKQFHFSAEDLLTCNSRSGGCNGGSMDGPYAEWVNVGLVSGGNYNSSEGCKPYSIPTCKNHMKKCSKYRPTPPCVQACQEGYNITYNNDKKRGKKYYVLLGEEDMMVELYKNGPITGCYLVYDDFANYKSGVYQHLRGEFLGQHAIKIMGWGVENGTKYWLIANSWGTDFGENGFFKILRGTNECSIDMYAIAGVPLLQDY